MLLANVMAQIPLHRGDLTIPQFCQNYRTLANFYGMENGYTLTNSGKWKSNVPEGTVVIYLSDPQGPPTFVFETDDDGKIQKVSFTVESKTSAETPEEDRHWKSDFNNQQQLASLAFVGARDEFPQFSAARRKMVQTIASHAFKDYSFREAGVVVACDVEQQGYSETGVGYMVPSKEGECSFYLHFDMSIEE